MYNAAPYLCECVDSILAQTFADFELLIVDDGSTDSSTDIVRSYSDPRIRLICRPHGFIKSLNTLLSHARGEYIARMDADDIMLPHRLHTQVSYLDTHPGVDAVSSCATRIDATGRPTGRIGNHSDSPVTITPRMMCEANHVCNPSTMIRRSAIESRSLSYDPAFEWAEDYAFWASLIGSGGVVHCLPDTLLLYRHSQGQVTSLHYDEMMEASDRIRRSLTSRLVAEANPGYTDPQLPESPHSLTLIIPFLNEGEEVGRTVRSFLDHGGKGRVEVMVINDCSYDSYPYLDELSQIGGVTYILNSERLGVAASRDKGVSLCTTPYFLLLDAHMRAYDDLWVTEIPRLLRQNDRRILCCQNKPLEKDGEGNVAEDQDTPTHYGARLVITRRPPVPGIDWYDEEREPDNDVESIPAVLGAGYAASRAYWQKLDGLRGLRQYGCDEQLISLKAWLDGGSCVLLKHVVLGHIYRKRMPYDVAWSVPVFNNLLVTETLFPLRERVMARAAAYTADRQRFLTSFNQIRNYLTENPDMRCCGSDHRKRFDNFREINSIPTAATRHFHADIEGRLTDIRDEVSVDLPSDPGLYEGKMGRALWLLSYAAAYGDTSSNNVAMKFVADIYDSLPVDDLGFASGISGIGWACLYLEQSGLISVPREVFESIDRHILPSLNTVSDTSFDKGSAGVLAYICARSASQSFRRKIDRYIPEIDSLANEILSVTQDPVAAYEALMWKQLKSIDFTEFPPLYLTDWIESSNFVARDKKMWSLSLHDGVLAASIKVIISNKNI